MSKLPVVAKSLDNWTPEREREREVFGEGGTFQYTNKQMDDSTDDLTFPPFDIDNYQREGQGQPGIEPVT